jgi:AcrR family transcriptional regulator
VPRLWSDTVEEHRRSVRDAVLDAAAALVSERGLTGVTMSGIAEATGIGRATLYKYFPDIDAVLTAWHERQIASHVQRLVAVRDATTDPRERLRDVLTAYAHLSRRHGGGGDLGAALHQGEHVVRARQRLVKFVGELIAEGVGAGEVRGDVPTAELAQYCLHALTAATAHTTGAAVRRLVAVTIDGLRPAGSTG